MWIVSTHPNRVLTALLVYVIYAHVASPFILENPLGTPFIPRKLELVILILLLSKIFSLFLMIPVHSTLPFPIKHDTIILFDERMAFKWMR